MLHQPPPAAMDAGRGGSDGQLPKASLTLLGYPQLPVTKAQAQAQAKAQAKTRI